VFLNNLIKYSDKIKQVHNQVKKAKQILKSEFFGIDDVIDQILQSIEPWLAMPEGQTKPTIINLWGMTGTGKTSLVRRMAEILEEDLIQVDLGEYTDHLKFDLIQVDLGEYTDHLNFTEYFHMNFEKYNSVPVMILLDEIQNPRTINEHGFELDRSNLRGLWSLLSDGKLFPEQETSYDYYISKILNTILIYKRDNQIPLMHTECIYLHFSDCFNNNSNCSSKSSFSARIVSQYGSPSDYKTCKLGREILEEQKNNCANLTPWEELTEWEPIDPIGFKLLSITEIKDLFLSKITAQTTQNKFGDFFDLMEKDCLSGLYILLKISLHTPPQIVLDFSQSLIFITGNMDEIYVEACSANPDITPDQLHEYSKNITVPDVKQALMRRFRPEQAARLGNNHILYPTFTEETFRKIINNKLKEINTFFKEKFNINLFFDFSVENIVYKEGVFPTQGARSVLSTISFLIEAFIPNALYLLFSKQDLTDKIDIMIKIDEDQEKIYFSYQDEVFFEHKICLHIESLRKPHYDNESIQVAIHEAGHTICSIIECGIYPNKVTAFSSASNSMGCTDLGYHKKIMHKGALKNRIVFLLGGWAAEKIIFGEDYICSGAKEDILQASYLASDLVKRFGMGDIPIFKTRINNPDEGAITETSEDVEKIKKLIDECQTKAINIIKDNELILLDLSQLLLEKANVNQKDLETLLNNHNKIINSQESIKDKFEKRLKDIMN